MELCVKTQQRSAGNDERTSRSTAWANAQALPKNGTNCRDSIREDPKITLGSYVKRAQTISFVECWFARLGLGHRTVVWVGSGQWISSKESGEFCALVILLISRTPWLGGLVVPPPPFFGAQVFPFISLFGWSWPSTCLSGRILFVCLSHQPPPPTFY